MLNALWIVLMCTWKYFKTIGVLSIQSWLLYHLLRSCGSCSFISRSTALYNSAPCSTRTLRRSRNVRANAVNSLSTGMSWWGNVHVLYRNVIKGNVRKRNNYCWFIMNKGFSGKFQTSVWPYLLQIQSKNMKQSLNIINTYRGVYCFKVNVLLNILGHTFGQIRTDEVYLQDKSP